MRELIEKIYMACSEYLNGSDLFGADISSIEKICGEFLQARGYVLRKSENVISAKPIKNVQDLIEYFYMLQKKYHPDIYIYRNRERDLSIASALIESRQRDDGLTKEAALKQCAAIIQTLFEEEDKFGFTTPITFGFLGQKNCGWITEMALTLLNDKMRKAKDEEDLLFANAHADKCNLPAGWSLQDIEHALKSLEGK